MKSEDGFALTAILVVFGVMAVIMTFAIVLVPLTQNETSLTVHETAATKSLYIAEAGLNDYVWHLNRLGMDYYEKTTHPAQGSGNWLNYEDGRYHLDVSLDTATASFIIESTAQIQTNSGTTERKIRAKVASKSFTQYIWLTNHETMETGTSPNNKIHFTSGDVIKGPLHSNDTINIMSTSSNPTDWAKFEQHVSTSKPIGQGIYYRPGDTGEVNFVDPTSPEESATPIDLPSTNTSLKQWADPAYNGGTSYNYEGATYIELQGATMKIDCVGSHNPGIEGNSVAIPPSGVIYVDGVTSSKGNPENADVFIRGHLNGRLTVAARNNIYIIGDLTYDNTTLTDPNNDDMLGLISDNYIYILHKWVNGTYTTPWTNPAYTPPYPTSVTPPNTYNSKDVSPTNITIYAAMLTLKHSYGFEFHDQDDKGTIHFKGSIAQNFRGAVGTATPTGYLKDYDYDPRMKYRQPPHFLAPANSGYEVISWEEIN